MTNEKTGGPAYPYQTEEWGVDSTGEKVLVDIKEPGMTLLDHFAGLAMQGILANMSDDRGWPSDDILTRRAYGYAAAMIAERNKIVNEKP